VVTEVTAHGVRDGEPDALAELCLRRGAAVLAFAEHVAAPSQAGAAAAQAFARFRGTVAAVDQLDGLDADALLLSATRFAAAACSARRTGPVGEGAEETPEECVRVERLLVRWLEDKLSAGSRERFESHLAECGDCRAVLERFEAAERAYQHPPKAPLPPAIARSIVGALVSAAPVTALDGDKARVREAAERKLHAAYPPAAAKPRAPVANATPAARTAENGVARNPRRVAAAAASSRVAVARNARARLGTALRERGAKTEGPAVGKGRAKADGTVGKRHENTDHLAVGKRLEKTEAPARIGRGSAQDAVILSLPTLATAGAGVGLFLALFAQPAELSGGLPARAVIPLSVLGMAIWLALVRGTYGDARRRVTDPRLVSAATALAVMMPIVGSVVYMILRPPESLEDAREREVSIASSEKLIEVLVELLQTQREIHGSVKHLEQGLHASRRRAAARRSAQTPGAPAVGGPRPT